MSDPSGTASTNPTTIPDDVLAQNNDLKLFIQLGAELLKQTNRPNVITLEQFEPFRALFMRPKIKPENTRSYALQINQLYNRYITELGINKYEVTYVILSTEQPKIVYSLDRIHTRIAPDDDAHVDGRKSVATAPRNINAHRDGEILDATISDLMAANATPEQSTIFKEVVAESTAIADRLNNFAISSDQAPAAPQTSQEDDGGGPILLLVDDDD